MIVTPMASILQQPRVTWASALQQMRYMQRFARAHLPVLFDVTQNHAPIWDHDMESTEYATVYIVICCQCNLVYIGSTLQALWQRFKSELSAARRYGWFAHKGKWRAHMNYCQHMIQCGRWNSVVFCIDRRFIAHKEFCAYEKWVRRAEYEAMRLWSRDRLLNTRLPHSSMVRTCPLTLSIFRQQCRYANVDIPPELLSAKNLSAVVNQLISSKHISMDPRTMLHIYTQYNQVMEADNNMLHYLRRVMVHRLQPLGIVVCL